MSTKIVANVADLNAAILEADGLTSGSETISIAGDFALGMTELDAINLKVGVALTIAGNSHTLSGGGMERGFFVYGGSVTISNLTLTGMVAQGGAGGAGGGGGGAGLGGALFVADNALADGGTDGNAVAGSVTLQNVTFSLDGATGGSGGSGQTSGITGGGGGLGGNGGDGLSNIQQGGGGGVGLSAAGGSGTSGSAGIIPGTPAGAAGGGAAGKSGGANGGGGGSAGADPHVAQSGSGGGVGAQGSTGGFGGGSGAGDSSTAGFGGGAGGSYNLDYGGFGGGGGGQQSIQSRLPGYAGNGGFGGGSGTEIPAADPPFVGSGGGGLGAGADVFVQQGANLTISGGTIMTGSVAGGAGGAGIATEVANFVGGEAGSALGRALFLQPTTGVTDTVSATIVNGTSSTGAAVVVDGPGTLRLTNTNTYTGGTSIFAGTVEIATASNIGTGAVTFAGASAFLKLDSTPSSDSTFADQISGFDQFGYIDLATLGYVGSATAVVSGTTLTLVDGATTLHFILSAAPAPGTTFHVHDDGARGTLLSSQLSAPAIITGTVAGQVTQNDAPISPFATATVLDPNPGEAESVTITLTGGGGVLTGRGVALQADGTYLLTGDTMTVNQELQILVFTPNVGALGSRATTGFALSDTPGNLYGVPFTTVDTATTVIDIVPAPAPPTITGAQAGQAVVGSTSIAPFTGVTVTDTNRGASDTLTITLSGGSGGVLLPATGLIKQGDGTYSITGTAAEITTLLQTVVYQPDIAAPNTQTTELFSLSDQSVGVETGSFTTVNSVTTVVDTTPSVAPAISNTQAGQVTLAGAPIQPFAKVNVVDPDFGGSDTLTITLSGAAGQLSGTGLVAKGGGVFTLSGPASTVTSQLQALTFTPAGTLLTNSTAFALSDVSTANSTVASDTVTTVTDINPSVTTSTVSTVADLNADIAAVNALSSGSYTIDIASNIAVGTTPLRAIALSRGVGLTVVGTGPADVSVLDGGGTGNVQRGLFVYSGTVVLQNLLLSNFTAFGGSAPVSGGGGGGGGAGLGGGLFVGAASRVVLNNVSFSGDRAIGGAGAAGDGFGSGTGGTLAGLAGLGLPSSAGTFGQSGGFGGGGAGGVSAVGAGGAGGAGGFGGGGGAGGSSEVAASGAPGPAGFGGGAGAGDLTPFGGGGLGGGADVFVQAGGSLGIQGTPSTSIADGIVTAGFSPLFQAAAIGPGIYLQGSGNSLVLDSNDTTVTVAASIVDDKGGAARAGYELPSGQSAPSYTEGSLGVTKGGVGTVVLAATNSYTGGTSIFGGSLELGGAGSAGSGIIAFMGANTTLQLDQVGAPGLAMTNTLTGFASTDILDLRGLAYVAGATATQTGGVLTVQDGSIIETFNVTNFAATALTVFADGSGGTEIACYVAGTMIQTGDGERPVETIAIGDRVVTASCGLRPVKWVGRRSYAGRFMRANRRVDPVRFRQGCLGQGLPARDLLVSQDHAMLLDGLLIPAHALVNGDTIRVDRNLKAVDYIHIELETHDVIFAEGAPSETFVDDDSRATFHNASDYEARYPDQPRGAAIYYAPRVENGYEVEAVRKRLAVQDMVA